MSKRIFARAILSDIPELNELLEILFNQEAEFEANSKAQQNALTKIILNPNIGIVLVAREDEKIIAMVNLLFTESTALGSKVAILEDMIVTPKSRSKGIGSELIDYAINEAKEEGCKRITLLTDIDNARAHTFYQKKGFVKSKMIPYRLLLDKKLPD
jgi:GNAT superfamily N-acetyltransferase